jgi:transketolase
VRAAFVRALCELAERDRRVLLLTGDIGFMALEPFAERFPERFVNVGVAEQNMVGLATGLAEAGWVPFVYSIATFAALRPYEFIRNGPAHHRLPVRIAGMGGGLEYGANGISHYALEDLGVLRVQPGVAVVAPADHRQVGPALRATADWPGPVYYRLGKDDRTEVPGLDGRFTLGRVERLRDGADLLLLAAGSVAVEAEAASSLLAAEGVRAAVAVVSSLRPVDEEDLASLLAPHRLVLTVEAHYETGGLGSLVSEVAAARALGCRVVRRAVPELPAGLSGSQPYLLERFGLSRSLLAAEALSRLRPGRPA